MNRGATAFVDVRMDGYAGLLAVPVTHQVICHVSCERTTLKLGWWRIQFNRFESFFIKTGFTQLIVYALLGENITVLGSRQVFDERILLRVFNPTHSISVLWLVQFFEFLGYIIYHSPGIYIRKMIRIFLFYL